MNLSRTRSIATPAAPATWKDWLTLTKPEITFLVTISSLAGFVMASTGGVDGWTLFWAMIGIPLTSAGGCALNQVLEVELDARMKRTANRPLPSGRIDVSHATWFAVGLIAAGVGILCPLTNPLTGVMAAVTVALYIWVYTPLKKKSTWNTLVGTIPGALPILGGWTAASGDVGAGGWALFGVLLCWQMPHFFALAWMYRKDYGESPFLMLPSGDEQGTRTALQMIIFSVLMIVFSVLPVSLGLSGMAYLVGALLLGGWFMVHVGRFWLTRSVQHARAVLKGSVMYIPLLLMAIILDRLLFVI
ncbi:MAG: protoheme IX farnesyltransferase [Bacteroidetes bacterium]|nr:protoheme IX farnesyltransferase [Bacteroidota bacterium]